MVRAGLLYGVDKSLLALLLREWRRRRPWCGILASNVVRLVVVLVVIIVVAVPIGITATCVAFATFVKEAIPAEGLKGSRWSQRLHGWECS